jgi:DNA-binding transcriptional regulator YiaG
MEFHKRQKELPMSKTRVAEVLLKSMTDLRDDLRKGPRDFRAKYTARTVELDLRPTQYDAKSVIKTRHKLSASQSVFAELIGVSVDAVQSWEQGINPPELTACRLMDFINEKPEIFLKLLQESVRDMAMQQEEEGVC